MARRTPQTRTPRTKLERGISQDAYGISVRIKVAGRDFEERHPLGTPIEALRLARYDLMRRANDTITDQLTAADARPAPVSIDTAAARAQAVIDELRNAPRTLCDRILAEITPWAWTRPGERRRPNKMRLRLAVIAATELLPTTVGHIAPADLDLEAGTVIVRDARYARYKAPEKRTLTAAGVVAFTAFAAGEAFGEPDTRYLAKCWQTATAKARSKWQAERPGSLWPLTADEPFELYLAIIQAKAIIEL
jgi:hypothetical protein